MTCITRALPIFVLCLAACGSPDPADTLLTLTTDPNVDDDEDTSGDGDPGDGDGDTGDGDGDTGDGDGDTGDGDGDTGDGDCGPFDNCPDLIAAFDAEALAIRSCSSDGECGQQLQGTSCGCTRDWVARTDADTTCFYSLIDQAGALQCELPLGSTCDCPEADGFICDGGICNWNYL
jgi:hypothetical protein